MRRRDLLNAGLAAAAGLAMPRIARADKAKTLVFVPTPDLAVLDPVVTFNRPTRNYAYLVFDTLYGIDTNWQAQPQMVAGHEVDDDGLAWTLKLREGLRFHVKEIVGSGPYRFLADEHVSGARAAFARFEEYRPRDAGGPAGALGFTSGPKT